MQTNERYRRLLDAAGPCATGKHEQLQCQILGDKLVTPSARRANQSHARDQCLHQTSERQAADLRLQEAAGNPTRSTNKGMGSYEAGGVGPRMHRKSGRAQSEVGVLANSATQGLVEYSNKSFFVSALKQPRSTFAKYMLTRAKSCWKRAWYLKGGA